MIKVSIVGDRETVLKLERAPGLIKARVDRTVIGLGLELEAYVKARKLSGQVLKVRTGRLRSSISQGSAMQAGDSRSGFRSTPNTAVYTVGTNVKYGAAWEHGARAHPILAKRGAALRFVIGGQVLFRKRVNMPAQAARPFLAPALEENRAHIIERVTVAAQSALTDAIKP